MSDKDPNSDDNESSSIRERDANDISMISPEHNEESSPRYGILPRYDYDGQYGNDEKESPFSTTIEDKDNHYSSSCASSNSDNIDNDDDDNAATDASSSSSKRSKLSVQYSNFAATDSSSQQSNSCHRDEDTTVTDKSDHRRRQHQQQQQANHHNHNNNQQQRSLPNDDEESSSRTTLCSMPLDASNITVRLRRSNRSMNEDSAPSSASSSSSNSVIISEGEDSDDNDTTDAIGRQVDEYLCGLLQARRYDASLSDELQSGGSISSSNNEASSSSSSTTTSTESSSSKGEETEQEEEEQQNKNNAIRYRYCATEFACWNNLSRLSTIASSDGNNSDGTPSIVYLLHSRPSCILYTDHDWFHKQSLRLQQGEALDAVIDQTFSAIDRGGKGMLDRQDVAFLLATACERMNLPVQEDIIEAAVVTLFEEAGCALGDSEDANSNHANASSSGPEMALTGTSMYDKHCSEEVQAISNRSTITGQEDNFDCSKDASSDIDPAPDQEMTSNDTHSNQKHEAEDGDIILNHSIITGREMTLDDLKDDRSAADEYNQVKEVETSNSADVVITSNHSTISGHEVTLDELEDDRSSDVSSNQEKASDDTSSNRKHDSEAAEIASNHSTISGQEATPHDSKDNQFSEVEVEVEPGQTEQTHDEEDGYIAASYHSTTSGREETFDDSKETRCGNVDQDFRMMTKSEFRALFHKDKSRFRIFGVDNSGENLQSVSWSDADDADDDQIWDVEISWKNRRHALLWLSLYCAANIVVFCHKAFQLLSIGHPAVTPFVILAKGSGAVLNLQGALILVTVSRHFNTWVQSTPLLRHLALSHELQLCAHAMIGISIAIFSTTHTIGHLVGFYRVANADDPQELEETVLGLIGIADLGSLSETSKASRWSMLLRLRASWTGIAMVLAMLSYLAIPARRKHFNTFWYLHQLLIVFLVLQCLHGTGNLLQRFQSVLWLALPMVLYLVPRVYRELSCRTSTILGVTMIPGRRDNLIVLTLEKPAGWSPRSTGMYVNMNVPMISRYEWHPFTMSSCPGDDHLQFHIRCSGDWTKKLQESLEDFAIEANLPSPNGDPIMQKDPVHSLSIRLEGPFGSPVQSFRDYSALVLIGAGIGVTPMISVLKDILHNPGRVRRVILYWTVRDKSHMEWFRSLLESIYRRQQQHNSILIVEMRQFLTSAKQDDRDLGAILLCHAAQAIHVGTHHDILLGQAVREPIQLGRPVWEKEFRRVVRLCQEMYLSKCGVFLCGPQPMAAQVRAACSKVSSQSLDDSCNDFLHKKPVHLYFSQETF